MNTRQVAFLRAINVGGRTVKMEVLRQLFETLGLLNVETFIASGNVIFDVLPGNTAELERKIETHLRQSLGFEVATFIRSAAELFQIVGYQAFSPAALEQSTAYNIAFLASSPTETAIQKLMTLRTEIDDFHVHGREVYWLCRKKQSESTFSNAVLEKTLGMASTLRGMNTVQKLVEKISR